MVYAFLAAIALSAPADLVVENAQIWTGTEAGFARFLAVRNGRFVHVGEPREDLVGPRTERVNAQGKLILPGFLDSHIHMLNGGMNLVQLQLRDAKSKEEFIERVRDWAEKLPEGKWILGGRWSTESWPVVEQPTKEWVDEASQGHPLYLSRMDGHSALVNSVALRMAGITKDTPNPPGGVIDKDPKTGEPTGILRESAMSLVSRLIPPPTTEEKVEALRRAMQEANRMGITTVCDIPSFADLPAYERLAAEGGLTVRFLLYPTADDWADAIRRLKSWTGKEGWMKVQGFKAYFDGSLGSRTAWMSQPYRNNPPEQPNWSGLPMPIVTDGVFLRNARAAAASGYQIIVHAIGDEANRTLAKQLLEVYGGAEALRRARPRSEHAQHLAPDVVADFGRLGILASMQPYHKADDGRYAEIYLGRERCGWSYAYRKLLNAGAVLAFGSDWPVVTQNVFLGMEAAVDARILNGMIWFPEERIPVTEAVRGYTTSAAFACFMENEIGRIAPGYRADFQILNETIFANEVRWNEVRPTAVFVEGKRVL